VHKPVLVVVLLLVEVWIAIAIMGTHVLSINIRIVLFVGYLLFAFDGNALLLIVILFALVLVV
jgi:hypothetical protein